MAKKFAVSLKDNGPLSFRWSKYIFEKGKPAKTVDNEEDAEYLRNCGLHVRELKGAELVEHSPHAAAAAKKPIRGSLERELEEEIEDEEEPPRGQSASDALETAVPPPPKKKVVVSSPAKLKPPIGKPQVHGRTS